MFPTKAKLWFLPILFAASMALGAIAFGQSAINVTGHVGDVSGNPSQQVSVQFQLAYTGGNVCRVVGQFTPVRQVVTLTPNSSGLISGTIIPNDVIECGTTTGGTRYNVSVIYSNIPSGQPQCFDILSTINPFNLDSAQPCTTLPVPVPPTGPQDAQVNNLTVNGLLSGGNATFTGTVTANAFNGPLTGNWYGGIGEGFGGLYAKGTWGAAALANVSQIGWNQNAGQGEMDFYDQSGTGSGGWSWYWCSGTNTTVIGSCTLSATMTGAGVLTATLNGNASTATLATNANNATNATNAAAVPASGITGTIQNSQLAHASTTVNGQTCTLGSSCTITFPTIQSLKITTGICSPSGTEQYCSMTLQMWPTAFADANWVGGCFTTQPTSASGGGTNPGVYGPYITAKTASTFTIVIQGGSNAAGGPMTISEVDCIGTHP